MPFKDLQPVQSTLALVVMPPKTPKIKTIYWQTNQKNLLRGFFWRKTLPEASTN